MPSTQIRVRPKQDKQSILSPDTLKFQFGKSQASLDLMFAPITPSNNPAQTKPSETSTNKCCVVM